MALSPAQLLVGSQQITETKDGYSITREYIVVSSDGSDNEFSVLFASGLPLFGFPHPAYPSAVVKNRTARLASDESKRMWIVTVTWNDQPEPDQNEPGETNPLAKEWDFRIVSTNREEVMVKDLEDTPIASSAGEPIRGVTREVADFAIVLSGNMAVEDIDFETIAEHMNQVNNALFFNVLAGNAKLVRFEGHRVRHPDFGYYFATSWEFAVREGGWDIEVLDEGFFELNGDGDQVIIAVKQEDADGNEGEAIPVSEPHLLDGSGHRTDTPNYLTFKRVTQKNMAALNIPTNFGAL